MRMNLSKSSLGIMILLSFVPKGAQSLSNWLHGLGRNESPEMNQLGDLVSFYPEPTIGTLIDGHIEYQHPTIFSGPEAS